MSTWDSCCDFLLKMPMENLFEKVGPPSRERYRCKGCLEIVKATERAAHHGHHRAGHTRSTQAARRRQTAQAVQNLEKARKARQEAPQNLPEPAQADVAQAPVVTPRTVTILPPPPPIPSRV